MIRRIPGRLPDGAAVDVAASVSFKTVVRRQA
jgi:hypothetical protein